MPYSLAQEFLPKSKLRRQVGTDHTMEAAADAANPLLAARAARQSEYDEPYGPEPQRPMGVADNVANDVVSRSVRTLGDGGQLDMNSVDDVARTAWQREASLNGNPAGDLTAPQSYIDSWKGQISAGEDAGPIGNLFKNSVHSAMQQRDAASGEADRQRSVVIAADYQRRQAEASARQGAQIRATTAPLISSTQGNLAAVIGQPPAAPAPDNSRQNLPDRGNAPAVVQTLPDKGTPAVQQNFSLVDQVFSRSISAAAPKPQGNDLEQHARAEARRLGINEDVAVRVAATEGGFADPVRQNTAGQPSYGPYQLYVGGAAKPGMGDDALQRGIDPRNPAHAKQAITFALEQAKQKGWTPFNGAAAAGIKQWDGIDRNYVPTAGTEAKPEALPMTGAAKPETTNFSMVDQIIDSGGKPAEVKAAVAQSVGVAPASVQVTQGGADWKVKGASLSANQYEIAKSLGLGKDVADAICGFIAAEAFVQATGRAPDYAEAIRLKEQVGWSAKDGMLRGSQGVVDLLKLRGVDAKHEKLDWNKVQQTVSAGQPVIINTKGGGGHFWVAQGFNASTGEYDLGNSAAILRLTKGRRWLTPAEIGQMNVGTPSEAIYLGGG